MKKVFDFWVGITVTILLATPAIGIIIQISHEAAKISYINNHGVVACVILIAGYALIWKTFKTLDKVAGQLGDVAASATGRARKALSDYRGNTMKRRTNEAIEGRREITGAKMATGLLRRAHMADKGGFNPFRQDRYRAAEQKMLQRTKDEMMKEDNSRFGGDDLGTGLAMQEGMTRKQFLSEYEKGISGWVRSSNPSLSEEQVTTRSRELARSALATAETSFGAEMGTTAMQVAAANSRFNSKTSYNDKGGFFNQQGNYVGAPTYDASGNVTNGAGYNMRGEAVDKDYIDFDLMQAKVTRDAGKLVQQGLMTTADAATMVKQRGDRADRSGVGHGYEQAVINNVVGRMNNPNFDSGDLKSILTLQERDQLGKEVLEGTGPGAILAQRHEAVRAMAPVMLRQVKEAATKARQAQSQFEAVQATPGATEEQLAAARTTAESATFEVKRQIASVAALKDIAQQSPALNRKFFGEGVLNQDIDLSGITTPSIRVVTRTNPTTGQEERVQERVLVDLGSGKLDNALEAMRTDEDVGKFRREFGTTYGAQYEAAQRGMEPPNPAAGFQPPLG